MLPERMQKKQTRAELINFSLDRTLKITRETMRNFLAQEKKKNDLLSRLIRLFLHGLSSLFRQLNLFSFANFHAVFR